LTLPLAPGEEVRVRFILMPDDLKLLDRDMTWTADAGTFEIR